MAPRNSKHTKTEDLVEHLSETQGLSRTQVRACLDAMIEYITDSLAKGIPVKLVNLGVLKTKYRPERYCHNPKTRELVKVEARHFPHFVAGKALKTALQKINNTSPSQDTSASK